jgi:hypothetical protein
VLAAAAGCPLTQIGEIDACDGLRFVKPDGGQWHPRSAGYDHFVAV